MTANHIEVQIYCKMICASILTVGSRSRDVARITAYGLLNRSMETAANWSCTLWKF